MGWAGNMGYVQRLAVEASARRAGLGSALVSDSLAWLAGHGVSRALVNTQVKNRPALALYHRLGFVEEGQTLAVLTAATRP